MKVLSAIFFYFFALIAYANEDLNLNVNINDPSFELVLPANPTTGYQWSIVGFNKNLLILNTSYFEATKSKLIGAGGQMHYIFGLQKRKKFPKNTVIKLKYARAWEADGGTMQVVNVNFK